MDNKKIIWLTGVILLVGILSIDLTSAYPSFSGSSRNSYTSTHYGSNFNGYYSSNQLNNYWPQLNDLVDEDSCQNRQDLLIQISPAGCQPTVVRSDLLEEQNVAVFCQLDALQFNPFVDIKQIRNIRFKGDYPEDVVGVGFHPAKAALRTQNKLLGSPLINNIGYVVVVLKKQESEREMPDFVNFTLTASLDYYSENAIGSGKGEWLLEQVSDESWEIEKAKNSFFNGKYSLRLLDADTEFANVAIYHQDRKVSEVRVQKRKESRDIYVPGSHCQASFRLYYDGLEATPKNRAKLQIGEDIVEVWEGSRFLNDKCKVLDITKNLQGSSVKINCQRKTFLLEFEKNTLSIGTEVIQLKNGKLPIDENGSWEKVFKIVEIKDDGSYLLNDSKGESYNFDSLENFVDIGTSDLEDVSYNEDDYFNEAVGSYEGLVNDFPSEKKMNDESFSTYGEQGLERVIKLAIDYNKHQTARRLILELYEKYPNSDNLNSLAKEFLNLFNLNSEKASQVVEVDNDFKHIRLIEIIEPRKKSSAKINWGREVFELELGQNIISDNKNLTLMEVYDSEKIKVFASCNYNEDGKTESQKRTHLLNLAEEENEIACGEPLMLKNVVVEEIAKIRLEPVVRTGGETNVSVGIGIEKRAFQLNPNKSRQKIKNLNRTIEEWESISENLGKVVKGLKGACFATAGILTVKNFFMGLGGESLARQQVMQGDNGWNQRCQDMVNEGTYVSVGQCMNEESSNIDAEVSAVAAANKQTNEVMGEIEKRHTQRQEGFWGGDVVDRDASAKEFVEKLRTDYGDEKINVSGQEQTVSDFITENSYAQRELSYTQARDLYKYLTLKRSGTIQDSTWIDGGIDRLGKSIDANREINQHVEGLLDEDVLFINSAGEKPRNWYGQTYGYYKTKRGYADNNIDDGTPSQLIHVDDQLYLVTLADVSGNNYEIDSTYEISENNQLRLVNNSNVDGNISHFKQVDVSSYQNEFLPGDAKVKFFESEPYKGMPAIVPFDKRNGWYAATKQTLPIGGNIKSYESNGRPSSFWVCNIMADRRIGFFSSGFGDDECVQFNLYTGQPTSKFPHLSDSETKQLVQRAITALNEASKHSESKIGDRINILGEMFEVGTGAASISATECQNYMSPDDCKLLFNVCDPVICPASRCNFGGKYYVSDVIQTGIVGSALLCLPNWNEGVMMPVCLTGIQAGIDGYLSILKQHQSCLQENIDSGKTVGICDTINSIYTCEFFWRQAAPLAKLALPKLVDSLYYGSNAPGKGGGEYLTVKSAWDNAQGSMDYFTQSYAVNSLEAFKVRSVEEAGSEVCRAWISMKGLTSFDTLIEPDSPSQFHAWFSSIPFAEATVPATAQYKVFYHIFAGKDSGASYNVYLKDPPEGAYHYPETVSVAGGFIPKGEAFSQTEDFTAPKGYKQLCVRINDQEECGFKQVSTSFAVNYASDNFVDSEMAKTDIISENECISGSLNAAALLNPNLQEAAQEAIDPAVYNRGIVRICATSNPGAGTDPLRFTEVGYCDDERIKCWLDSNSVDNAFTAANTGIRENASETLEGIQSGQGVFSEDFALIDGKTINQKREELNNKITNVLKDISRNAVDELAAEFDRVIDLSGLNSIKAMFRLMKGDLYEQVFRELVYPKISVVVDEPGEIEELVGEENIYGINEESSSENEGAAEEELTGEVILNYSINENNGTEFIFVGEIETSIRLFGNNLLRVDAGTLGEINIMKVESTLIVLDKSKLNSVAEDLSPLDIVVLEDLDGKNYQTLKDGKIEISDDVQNYLNSNS